MFSYDVTDLCVILGAPRVAAEPSPEHDFSDANPLYSQLHRRQSRYTLM